MTQKTIAMICAAVLGGLFIFVFLPVTAIILYAVISSGSSNYANDSYQTSCNVAGIRIAGEIVTSQVFAPAEDENENTPMYVTSEDVVQYLEQIQDDDYIKAVLVSVDSYGGSGAAAEEIGNAIKITHQPSVSVIRGAGTSAGYEIASAAQYIFAGKNSDIGSIGVTASYLDETEKNRRDGVVYQQLIAGKYKDLYSADKPLTQQEKTLILEDLNKMQKLFIETVAKNRGLEVSKVAGLADGRSYLGEDALTLGLIDEIGDMFSAKTYLEEKIGEPVEICWMN